MNINFDNNGIKTHSNVDRVTTSNSGSRVEETGNKGVFALDISGTVMDNTAYDGQGKTAEDVMQEAGQIDVATQKNYMAVMSNTMSGEDFARLQEEGYHPGNTEIETVVTIVDEIKAALAKGGKHIAGYTDDLDVETLTRITGSAAFANELVKQFGEYDIPITKENVEDVLKACKRAIQIDDLNDGVKKYMVRNHMETTVDNLYKAQYSTAADAGKQGKGYYQDAAGYYAKKADTYDWQQLAPQIEKVIENAGLEVSEETFADAKWLIEKGVPLTEESLQTFHGLNDLELPRTLEDALKAAAAAIANGRGAGCANLADGRTDMEKTIGYIEDVASISEEAVDLTVQEGKILNIRNLKAAQLQIDAGILDLDKDKSEAVQVNLSGRRQLEEVRLQMTVQANLYLIRRGFAIDTAELTQLVDALKSSEQHRQEVLFGGNSTGEISERAKVYEDTLAKVREIPHMPAALAGRITHLIRIDGTDSINLERVHAEGNILRSSYEKAGESYETLMTAPRSDMGDSIQKAFRNVDDILRSMNLDVSDENRRAVRILGYNQMEISEENIVAVKENDLTIKRAVEKMTPGSVLEMIRDGKNPLIMSIEELENYFSGKEREPEKSIEKYSEFLYKLEKSNAITAQEKEAYIGIYRLFRQLDKTDGAAIGTLIHQGMEPTVGNLLSAMRSNKKHGMDRRVDDFFGGVSSVSKNKSISEQIDSYYRKLSADIFDHLESGKLSPEMISGDMNLEKIASMLREQAEDLAFAKEYQREQIGTMREAMRAEDAVVKELLEFDQPVTANNLLASGLLMKERGKLAGRMRELAEGSQEEENLEEAIHNLHENMTDEASAGKAYHKLGEVFNDILEEVSHGRAAAEVMNINSVDIREISNMYKQVSLVRNLAKEENYEVPVNIDGEITSINLRIIHDADAGGSVTATMQTETYGKAAARFHITRQPEEMEGLVGYQMSGYVICDHREGLQVLSQSREQLEEALGQSGISISSLNYIYHQEIDLTEAVRAEEWKREKGISEENNKGQEVPTKKLYDTAKIFIGYIQKGEGF